MRKILTFTAIFIAVVSVSVFAYLNANYTFIKVRGQSMYPTFTSGDTVVLSKEKSFAKDQIVLFSLPPGWKDEYLGNDDTSFVKRISVMPGQTLEWDGEFWYADGVQFAYVKTGSCPIDPLKIKVPEGKFFVTGDTSTSKTLDSREAFCKDLPYLVSEDEIEAHGFVERVF